MTNQKTHIPPALVAKEAEKGLTLREQFHRGGTEVGVKRAKDLRSRKAMDETEVKKIFSYFRRHAVDKQAKDFENPENPSAGYIAWLLWGGDAGYEWVKKILGEK